MKTIHLFFAILLGCLSPAMQAQTLVKDINLGASSSSLDHLTHVPTFNKIVFIANNGTSGVELFTTDGTAAGTVLIKDIYPGANPSYPLIYREYNSKLYFRASNNINGYELWESDLTVGGTTALVKDAWPGTSNGVPLTTNGFVIEVINGNMIMPLSNGTTANGTELWRSDGTTAGTGMIADIYPGTGSSSPKEFAKLSNTLMLFSAYQYDIVTATGVARELFRTNGTPGGTNLVMDINPGLGSSSPTDLTVAGGNVFFSANDGINGKEVWISDGTPGGTNMLKDIHPTGSSDPEGFTQVGAQLFFFADDGTNGQELWKTNGTTLGTVMVKDINPGAASSKYIIPYTAAMGGILYFNATDGVNGTELWRSDGTAAGTYMLADMRPGPFGSNPNGFYAANGKLFLSAYDPADGFELWVSDGVQAAKEMSFIAGTSCGCPGDFVVYNNIVYFTASTTAQGRELWAIDPAGALLPLDNLELNAKSLSNGFISLNWTTSSTMSHAYYVLERSADGSAYKQVAQISANYDSTKSGLQIYTDRFPMNGRNLYRLKYMTQDGIWGYSSIAAIFVEENSFSLFPTRVIDQVQVSIPYAPYGSQLVLLNTLGQELKTYLLSPETSTYVLPVSHLNPGIYLIRWESEKGQRVQRFLKE